LLVGDFRDLTETDGVMKILIVLLLLSVASGLADEKRVIAYYLPDREGFVNSCRGLFEQFGRDGEFVEPEEISKAPFQSRFFAEPGRMWDFTEMLRAAPRSRFAGGHLVYHEASSRLVMKGSWGEHCAIDQVFRACFDEVATVQLRIFEADGIDFGEAVGLPPNARQVGDFSFRFETDEKHQLGSENGDWKVDLAVTGDRRDSWKPVLWCEFSLGRVRRGREWGFESTCLVYPGAKRLVHLGKVDGEKTLFMTVDVALFLKNGEPIESWALDEKDGAFLTHQKLAEVVSLPEAPEGFQVFRMPFPIEENDYPALPWWPDPKSLKSEGLGAFQGIESFANNAWRHLIDLRPFLKGCGLSIGDRTYCYYQASRAAFFTNAQGDELMKIRWCFDRMPGYLSNACRFELGEMISSQRVTRESIEADKLMGQLPVVAELWEEEVSRLGSSSGLSGSVRFDVDRRNPKVMGVDFALNLVEDSEMPNFCASVVVQSGVPVVLRQEKVDGKWKALVLRSTILTWLGERIK
jgi:hypothetical protein